jgi:oligoribonuclease NrnB/cAMP/cGMP phosphodiesterase (DHH superfamily)
MNTYNFVIIDDKVIYPFLNILNENEFLEKLWEWCCEDDLWDYLDETPEVLTNSEDLENFLFDIFIPENLFHRYEDDDLNCFAFTASDEKLDVREYNEDRALQFVLNKIKEHYD